MQPNFLVILIDDLRFDEFGAGGHPYMKTPHIDRLAKEGLLAHCRDLPFDQRIERAQKVGVGLRRIQRIERMHHRLDGR